MQYTKCISDVLLKGAHLSSVSSVRVINYRLEFKEYAWVDMATLITPLLKSALAALSGRVCQGSLRKNKHKRG